MIMDGTGFDRLLIYWFLLAFHTIFSYIVQLHISKTKIMRKTRTIVLEDNLTEQGILKYLLKARNHEVITYDNPSICPLQINPECRCNDNERCTDILISDLNMPIINGLDYIKYSIESVDDEMHKEIRGSASNFRESYDKILTLLDLKKKKNFI